MNENENNEEIKKLVLARIEVMPQNYKLSIGNFGTLAKEELIMHVKEGDTIGQQMINMQLRFIKALTSGKLVETLNKNE